jgi:hypothetical protein
VGQQYLVGSLRNFLRLLVSRKWSDFNAARLRKATDQEAEIIGDFSTPYSRESTA